DRIEAFIFKNFVPTSSEVVQQYLGEFSQRARGLSIIGFGFLLVTTFMLEAAKNVLNMVVANSAFTSIYGAFAAVPFFLFWMYMVWVLILSGAIFVRTLALTPEVNLSAEPAVVKCARVLQMLYRAHLEGRGISDREIEEEVSLGMGEKERILKALLDLRVLRQADEVWILGRSLKAVTLWELYQELPHGLDLANLERIRDMDHVVEPLKALVQFGSNQMSVSLDTVFGGVQ
ncbi:MAG: YhjD/YihY/BrkB family envelope integrity protein, partial [Gammaproteobacteria bacterium]